MRRLLFALLITAISCATSSAQTVTVGSKKFTESYVLGEVIKQTLKVAGVDATHKQGLGATGIVWAALTSGQISVYPEYSGTIAEELLKKPGIGEEEMRSLLQKQGIGITKFLGFNDTYTLAMRSNDAKKLGIRTITDLRTHPDLRVAITHEFLERKDGWKPLVQKYGLKMSNVRGVEHTLGYEALASGEADVKDAYSTDAKLIDPQFTILKDDLNYFPAYQAVLLYRLDLPANVISVLKSLEGHIDEKLMVAMNAEAEKSKDYTKAATLAFVGTTSASGNSGEKMEAEHLTSKLVRWTLQHLKLVMISLLAAVLVGIPLGVYAARGGVGGQIVLSVVGMIQTIPSLALLALLVPLPFFGISSTTAIVALFLYSLLPIVRNTATGLQDIPQNIRESAEALGMDQSSILRKIYLPLASRSILSGIKTSAVINVGTATLAALIGAGGFGEPIVSGLSLNDNATILQGAIPAAILALLVQFGFDRLDNLIIPKGLRLKNRVEN